MFTGRFNDEETGLYYYRARYYDPETGRFVQRDPAGYSEGPNLFQYVGCNVPNFRDSSSRFGFLALLLYVVAAVAVASVTALLKYANKKAPPRPKSLVQTAVQTGIQHELGPIVPPFVGKLLSIVAWGQLGWEFAKFVRGNY